MEVKGGFLLNISLFFNDINFIAIFSSASCVYHTSIA